MTLSNYDALPNNIFERIRRLERQVAELSRWAAPLNHVGHHELVSLNHARIARGLYVGSTEIEPDEDDVFFEGNMKSVKNTSVYDVYGFVPAANTASTTYWGQNKSTQAKTLLDMSTDWAGFLPSDTSVIKAYLVRYGIRDSGSASSDTWIILSENSTAGSGYACGPAGRGNNYFERGQAIIMPDVNGDIFVQIQASGSNTMQIYLALAGYWL